MEIGDTELVSTDVSMICANVELLLVEQCGLTVGQEEGEMEKLYIGALRVGRANVFFSLTLAEVATQAKLPPTQSKAYAQGQTKVRTPRYRVGHLFIPSQCVINAVSTIHHMECRGVLQVSHSHEETQE